jgi:hypothetical protein
LVISRGLQSPRQWFPCTQDELLHGNDDGQLPDGPLHVLLWSASQAVLKLDAVGGDNLHHLWVETISTTLASFHTFSSGIMASWKMKRTMSSTRTFLSLIFLDLGTRR